MYSNIGGKIKGLAKLLFWIVAIGSAFFGIAAMQDSKGISLLWALAGILGAWISSWFLYGFGEIIDKLSDIERNTRGAEAKSKTQIKTDDERIVKLEKLRAQGLITEEEYRQAITREEPKDGEKQ